MNPALHDLLGQWMVGESPFVLATVVAVHGSASAQPGSRALIDAGGVNRCGWVGGGCAEAFVCEEALLALEARRSRTIEVDLDDEILGVGMPCGGKMDVFLEPIWPAPRLLIAGEGALAASLSDLAGRLGWRVRVAGPPWPAVTVHPGESVIIATRHAGDAAVSRAAIAAGSGPVALIARRGRGEAMLAALRSAGLSTAAFQVPAGLDLGGTGTGALALSVLAGLQAAQHNADAAALQITRGGPVPPVAPVVSAPELVLIGRTRITEAMARLARWLGWPVIIDGESPPPGARFPDDVRWVEAGPTFEHLPISPRSVVIVAAHHKGDHHAIHHAIRHGAPYVGLVASAHRSGLVREMVAGLGCPDTAILRAPAGLRLGGRRPVDVALSVLCEAHAAIQQRSGRFLQEGQVSPGPGCIGCVPGGAA